ncbi:hypothetical protein MKZ20_01450 [Psychrobacillus sp. FSL K6-2684]|nr:hypothetical protein [Psychrobacillus sp. AK 1817]
MIIDIIIIFTLVIFIGQSFLMLSYFKTINKFFQEIQQIDLPKKEKQ